MDHERGEQDNRGSAMCNFYKHKNMFEWGRGSGFLWFWLLTLHINDSFLQIYTAVDLKLFFISLIFSSILITDV